MCPQTHSFLEPQTQPAMRDSSGDETKENTNKTTQNQKEPHCVQRPSSFSHIGVDPGSIKGASSRYFRQFQHWSIHH